MQSAPAKRQNRPGNCGGAASLYSRPKRASGRGAATLRRDIPCSQRTFALLVNQASGIETG